MASSRDWKKEVLELRRSAEELRESHPDAALMRCRKATEAILLSIYEEVHGKLPDKYFPHETMMSKLFHHNVIPEMQRLEFNTAQQWGNFGSHYQDEGPPNSKNVDFALGPLDNLIHWRFELKNIEEPSEEDDFEEFDFVIAQEEMAAEATSISITTNTLDWMVMARMGKKGFRCMVCGFWDKRWSKVNHHRKITHHETIKCEICDQHITSKSQLNKHEEKTGHIAQYKGDPIPSLVERSIGKLRDYLIGLITHAYVLESTSGDEWVNLAAIGSRAKEIEPEFDIRLWGTKKWSTLIEDGLNDVFEMRKLKIRHSGKSLKKPSTFEIKPISVSDS